jgi:hypothetical protein
VLERAGVMEGEGVVVPVENKSGEAVAGEEGVE